MVGKEGGRTRGKKRRKREEAGKKKKGKEKKREEGGEKNKEGLPRGVGIQKGKVGHVWGGTVCLT
jgi:hypothetical protein